MAHGWSAAQQGALSPGIDEMRLGLAAFKATGSAIVLPLFQTMLAELLGRAGQPAEGIRLLDNAMAQVNAWEERWQEPEIHRVRGMLMALEAPGVPRAGEASLRQALLVAERLQAPGWQLRAALQLAHHLHARGEHAEAKAVLAPVHSTFSEGRDTADLRDADALLASITRSVPPPS